MSRQAYVLIQAEMGLAEAAAKALRGKPGIRAADVVTGPHDIIAVVHGADSDAVAKTVLNVIQTTKGVKNTSTYMVVSTGPSE